MLFCEREIVPEGLNRDIGEESILASGFLNYSGVV